YFKILRPARFFRNIRPLRKTPLRRFLMDAAAWSGAGLLAIRALRLLRARSAPAATAETAARFGPWADELWTQSHLRYTAIAVRDSAILNNLYSGDGRFLIWRIMRLGQAIGWAVALDTQMQDDRYFGNLRVGSIVDTLAQPEDAPAVIAAASRELERRGV